MRWDILYKRAERSLLANIVTTDQGQMLAAGAHQFRTLWVRDFCFSVPGLLVLGKEAIVKRQIDLIFSWQRYDGLMPRGLDVVSPKLRVLWGLYGENWLGLNTFFSYEGIKKLKPEYLGEHGTVPFDSNILVLLAGLNLVQQNGDLSWLKKKSEFISKALSYYQIFLHDGLFHQPKFSDWEDSLKRSGPQLYFHLLLLDFYKKAEKLNIESDPKINIFEFESKIFATFLKNDLWKNQSFTSLLWALRQKTGGFILSRESFLQEFPVQKWGFPSPQAPDSEVSWNTRLIGLKNYHRAYRWSWLMAEAVINLKTLYPDLCEKTLDELAKISSAEDRIAEIYDEDQEVKLGLYRSEAPFSWGAAKILEALTHFEANKA